MRGRPFHRHYRRRPWRRSGFGGAAPGARLCLYLGPDLLSRHRPCRHLHLHPHLHTSTPTSNSTAAAASASALTSALASASATRRPCLAAGVRPTEGRAQQQRRRQRARRAKEERAGVAALQRVVRLVAPTQRSPPLARPVREGVTQPRALVRVRVRVRVKVRVSPNPIPNRSQAQTCSLHSERERIGTW